jgi:hypothetical protein
MPKKKLVFRIYHYISGRDRAYIVDSHEALKEAMGEIPELIDQEYGDKWIIEIDSMTQKEIDALPEFDGF